MDKRENIIFFEAPPLPCVAFDTLPKLLKRTRRLSASYEGLNAGHRNFNLYKEGMAWDMVSRLKLDGEF